MSDTIPATGLCRDGTYQAGARRTFTVTVPEAWTFLLSQRGTALWLGEEARFTFIPGTETELKDGTALNIRVVKRDSHLRLSWRPPVWARASTIQIRVIPRGTAATISFHQEGLPSAQARRERLSFFQEVLDRLEQLFPGREHVERKL